MSNRRDSRSALKDENLLDFSIIDLITLQKMSYLREPTIRYQIMQEIKETFPEIAPAKVYRILDKFIRNELVITVKSNDDKIKFELSEKGRGYIASAQQLINQLGFDVFAYFESEFPKISSFLQTHSNRMLLIDRLHVIDLRFMEVLSKDTLELHVVYPESIFQYFHRALTNVKQSMIIDKVIKEPDNYFDCVLLYLPSKLTSDLVRELLRVLKSNSPLFITSIDEIKHDHFVHNILFEQFAPPLMKRKIKELDFNLLDHSDWQFEGSLKLFGLNFFKYISK